MPSFFAALRSYLKSVPELSDLTDIYSGEAPVGDTFPYLIIDELWELPHNNATDSYYGEVAYQFTLQARDKGEAKRLSDVAYDALWRTRMPILGFDGGYEMDGRERGQKRGPKIQTSGRPEGDKVWMRSFDYTFLIGRNPGV